MKSKCMKDGNTKQDFIKHQSEYEQNYGLTEFSTIDDVNNNSRATNTFTDNGILYAIKEYLPKGYKPTREEFVEWLWAECSEEEKEEEWVKFS